MAQTQDAARRGGTIELASQLAPPTLEQMRCSAPWLPVPRANSACRHKAPMTITLGIIRWGADTSIDKLPSVRAVQQPS